MKINSDLGYEPVTYSELTTDEEFWKGCKSCVNYEILMSKERKNCMCTAMLFDPEEAAAKLKMQLPPVKSGSVVTPQGELLHPHHYQRGFKGNLRLFERWVRFKQYVLLKAFGKRDDNQSDGPERRKSILSFFFFW